MFLLPLTKEHILMRNQNLVGFKLPELSEAAEQDKGRLWGPVCPPRAALAAGNVCVNT